MKILLTGGTGNLGSALREYMELNGIMFEAPGKELLNDASTLSEIQHYLEAVFPTHIINCAGITGLDNCEKFKDLSISLNSIFPIKLVSCAKKLDLPLIHISTDNVFSCNDPKEKHLETSRVYPNTYYGTSKRFGELAVMDYKKGLVIRLPLLFSSKKGDSRLIINNLFRKLVLGQSIKVATDVFNTPILIEKAAENLIKIIENFNYKSSELIHICGNKRVSLHTIMCDVSSNLCFGSLIKGVKSDHFKTLIDKPKFGGLESNITEPLKYENSIEEFLKKIHMDTK